MPSQDSLFLKLWWFTIRNNKIFESLSWIVALRVDCSIPSWSSLGLFVGQLFRRNFSFYASRQVVDFVPILFQTCGSSYVWRISFIFILILSMVTMTLVIRMTIRHLFILCLNFNARMFIVCLFYPRSTFIGNFSWSIVWMELLILCF